MLCYTFTLTTTGAFSRNVRLLRHMKIITFFCSWNSSKDLWGASGTEGWEWSQKGESRLAVTEIFTNWIMKLQDKSYFSLFQSQTSERHEDHWSSLVPRPHSWGEGLVMFGWFLGLLAFCREFLTTNHFAENSVCSCNTGNPWLLQHDDTNYFGMKLVFGSQLCIQ